MPSRRLLPLLALAALAPRPSLAVEAEAELALGPRYAWLSAEGRGTLRDGRLVLGAGFVGISDYQKVRAGLRALVGAESEHMALALALGYGPPQEARSFYEVEPAVTLRHEAGALELEWTARVGLRRADVEGAGAIEPIDQVQMQLELVVSSGERLELQLLGDVALYDRDLSRPWRRATEVGPLVTIAGRPESAAVRARAALRVCDDIRLEVGLAALRFADGSGWGLLPEAAIRFGPLGGARVGAAVAPLVPLEPGGTTQLTVRLEVGWER